MRRRTINVFGLSFLDVMFCGFGSVILLVMIVNADALARRERVHPDLRAELVRLEREALAGAEYVAKLRASLATTETTLTASRARATQLRRRVDQTALDLAAVRDRSQTRSERIRSLQTELKSLDAESQRLAAAAHSSDEQGQNVRRFVGRGDRQYLTGLKMGGRHIAILVDASASMLDETIVNIIRTRNLPDAAKRRAPKWRRVLGTVEWLVSQLPATSQFQIYTFNTEVAPVVPGTQKRWLAADDRQSLDEAVDRLHRIVPTGGTSLSRAFIAVKDLRPRPDNIILLTDGLPTQGTAKALRSKVSGEQRLRYFNQAVAKLPTGVPVNTILFPIEGDPFAASAFWKLAVVSNGSFLSPSGDWP